MSHHQVFISFRGKGQREKLISFLTKELERNGINFFIDEKEPRGSPITILFERIRESSVALVFFSEKYPESPWCLDELVEIKKQMETRSLVPLPVFYKVKADSVKRQTGSFGNTLLRTEDDILKKVNRGSYKSILETEAMIRGWREALVSVGGRMGFSYKHSSDEAFVSDLVVKVKELVAQIPSPRTDQIVIKNHLMHPQEAIASLSQVLRLRISIPDDVITKPIHINGLDSLVFLDMNSLKNSILPLLLNQIVHAGKIPLVLLGSLEHYNEGFAFKPLLFPKRFTGNKLTVSFQEIQDQSYSLPVQGTTIAGSSDNVQNRPGEHNNSSDALTCCSFLCNVVKLLAKMICPSSQRVSISFGNKQLKKGIVSSLVAELESNRFSVCVEDETKERFKESKVSIVVFSGNEPESQEWLDELVEIKTLMDAGEIDPLPIFYMAESVKNIEVRFRNRRRKIENEARKNVNKNSEKSILDSEARFQGWRQAFSSIASRPGLSNQQSTDVKFVADVVTKVKELFATRERQRKSTSYINTNLVEEKPLMHRQETSTAITAVKSLDDDLFYTPTSFLKALNLEITDLEGFKEMSNGFVSLSVKEHTNLVFLKLNSLEHLVRFQRSDAFEFIQKAIESNKSIQFSNNRLIGTSQDQQIPSSDTNVTATMF